MNCLTVDFVDIDKRGVDSLEGGIVLLCGASELVQRTIDGKFRFGEFELRSFCPEVRARSLTYRELPDADLAIVCTRQLLKITQIDVKFKNFKRQFYIKELKS